MFRLGQILHLPEALTFYYAHVGYYITQGLVSASMPILARTLEGFKTDDEAPHWESQVLMQLRSSRGWWEPHFLCEAVSGLPQDDNWTSGNLVLEQRLFLLATVAVSACSR